MEKNNQQNDQYITLRGGLQVSADEAKKALDSAMEIIEKVGTTGINHCHEKAGEWMLKYYPMWS